VFRDSVGRVGRHARDGEAQFPGGAQVHAIESGAAQGYVLHPHFRERLEARPVHAIVDKGTYRLCAVRGCGGLRGEAPLHEAPVDLEPG